MAMKQISKSGYDKLKEELDYLVGVNVRKWHRN